MSKTMYTPPKWWTMPKQQSNAVSTIDLILPKATYARLGDRVVLNGHLFINGVHRHVGLRASLAHLVRWFERSYEVTVVDVVEGAKVLKPVKVEKPKPTPRQKIILTAVKGLPSDTWEGEPPHPSVAEIVNITKDSTITLEEIVEVISQWLV